MFSITCTTCRARLSVRNEEAIGAILECPKCGGMVKVVPPEDWQAEGEPDRQPAEPHDSGQVAVGSSAQRVFAGSPPNEVAVGDASHNVSSGDASHDRAEVPAGAETRSFSPVGAWASPAELLWRKWLLLGALPVAGLVVAVGVWSVVVSSRRHESRPPVAAEQPVEPTAEDQPSPTIEEPSSSPAPLDRRWLPDRTTLLFSVRPSQLAAQPQSGKVVDQLAPVWQPTVGMVLRSFALELGDVGRLTWASTDLSAWPTRSVVVIELEPGQEAGKLAAAGEPVELSLGGTPCRRLSDASWTHPFAVVNPGTIVTGHAELLRRLPRPSEVELESPTLRRLLEKISPEVDFTLLVDLGAAQKASWELPTALLDVWPSGRKPWHLVWEMPEGLGCSLQWSDRLRIELALACEGETAAEKVRAAMEELTTAGRESLSAQIESLPAKLRAGKITAAAADQYGLLLKEAVTASQAARCEVAGETVWVRVDWGQGPSLLAAAILDSRSTIRADWLAAAREVDEANHRRLLTGLGGYQKAEGRFPAAAAGGALLPPETRLSWIATMLPYFDRGDWHRRLEFGYGWNSPQNRDITRQPLSEVVNPALGPAKTEAGFPVTHYVGLSGVGPDAGRLKADDPRAGLFGYGRATRQEDIADGAANTIALLGVAKGPGPWAAGGKATVRALTKRPYVNGPDGFGSGQPDGMLAGMADGSVRFISKDVDPEVLEQLATIDGHERATVAALDTTPASPRPEPKQPQSGPEDPDEPAPSSDAPAPSTDVPPDNQPEHPPGEADKGPAAEPVDVEARLAETIPEIEFRDTPLADAVGLLAAMSAVPVTFDPEAMSQLGVTLRDPLTMQLSETRVDRILEAVVSSRGLAAVVESGHVLITSPADHREKLTRKRYTVSDLTGGDAAGAAELAALVQKLVAPDSWRAGGGRGTIEPEGGALLVMQTGIVHHQVLVFCEKLRTARGKPLRSRHDPSRFALTTRRGRAEQVLGRPVTANFHDPVPLIEILAHLGQLTESDVLIDRSALGAAGLSDNTQATLEVQEQPLATALDELLKPLGLAYRAIDAHTLQVTTRKAVAARLELEFYPVGQRLGDGQTGPGLIEQIKGSVAGSTWSDAGGAGVAHFDQPSNCLIVLQSQPVQAAAERFLRKDGGVGG